MLFIFFFNDTATTEIYTLSLHDALPISVCRRTDHSPRPVRSGGGESVRRCPSNRSGRTTACVSARSTQPARHRTDRKSTRLNSSHANISYAVFCLKKKNNTTIHDYDNYI